MGELHAGLLKKLRAGSPCRTLDIEIAKKLGRAADQDCLRYTTSIDAAMTLLPEECRWSWTLEADAAWVKWMGRKDVEDAQGTFFQRGGECTALALCVAAIEATARMSRLKRYRTPTKKGAPANG